MEIFAVDDIVTVQVPREDRASADDTRMYAIIHAVPHEGLYRLRTQYGIISRLYHTNVLLRVPATAHDSIKSTIDFETNRNKFLTLGAAAALNSTADRVQIKCKCATNCDTKRCKCYKNEQRCTVYCHVDDDHPCINFAPLGERTQASLVQRPTAGAAVGLSASSQSSSDAVATTSDVASLTVLSDVVRRSKRKQLLHLLKVICK